MQTVAVARNAMATRFEIVLHGENPVALRAAGEEALDEIDRIESRLSLYRPASEIAHLNARAAAGPVRVTPVVFRLLQHARQLSRQTQGTFDITVAPLVRCWGFMGGTGQLPQPEELAAARNRIGMDLLELDENNLTVKFTRDGVMLDLGAIGKGYAVERAAELLREAGIESALINGGTSSIYAIGHPPEQEHWKIAVEHPVAKPNQSRPDILATVPLRDEAMSVSAVWGRSFEANGQVFGHVLDPRTGQPVNGAALAAVTLPSATDTDAFSTALLVLGEAGQEPLAQLRPGLRTLVVTQDNGAVRVTGHGISTQPATTS